MELSCVSTYDRLVVWIATEGQHFLLQSLVFEHVEGRGAVAVATLVDVSHPFPEYSVTVDGGERVLYLRE